MGNPLSRLHRTFRKYFCADEDDELRNSWLWIVLTKLLTLLLSLLILTLVYYVFLVFDERNRS